MKTNCKRKRAFRYKNGLAKELFEKFGVQNGAKLEFRGGAD